MIAWQNDDAGQIQHRQQTSRQSALRSVLFFRNQKGQSSILWGSMATRLKALAVEIVGWGLLALAVLVSPLPVIPSLLLLAALFLLSSRYSWASRLLQKTRRVL